MTDGNLNNGNPWAPSGAPTKAPGVAPVTSGKRISSLTIDAVISETGKDAKLDAITSRLRDLQDSGELKITSGIQGELQQMQAMLDKIKKLAEGNQNDKRSLIQQHVEAFEVLYYSALAEQQKIEADSQKARDDFLPNELLTQSDSIFNEHIRDSLNKAENWSINEILDAAREIKIESNNIGAKDWDYFFDDLRDGIPENKIKEFNQAILEFKEKNPELYNGTYLDTHLGVDITNMAADIDSTLEGIGVLPEGTPISVNIGDLEVEFKDKKAAVLYMYKIKLVFAELASNSENIFSTLFSLWWAGNTFIVNTGVGVHDELPEIPYIGILGTLGVGLLTLSALVVFNLSAIGSPIESITRNVKDILAIKFGNNKWSKVFGGVARGAEGFEKWAGTSAFTTKNMPILGRANPLRLIQLTKPITQVISTVAGGGRIVFEGAEAAYLETGARDMQYTLLDGIVEPQERGQSGPREEALRRLRVLDYYKNKWYFDVERLEKLDKLASGSIYSNTETFWLRIWEIDKGQFIFTERGESNIDNLRERGTNLFHHTRRIFWFPNKEEEVMKDYNKNVGRSADLLREIFKDVNVPEGPGKITHGETKNPFFVRLEDYIGLHSGISNEEETRRKGLLDDLINAVKNGKFHGTVDELKTEIGLIVKGYEPRFKMLERVSNEIKNASLDSATKGRFQSFLDMIEKGNWTGTKDELERAITDITHDSFSFNEAKIDISPDELTRLESEGKALGKSKFSEKLGSGNSLISYFSREIDLQSMIHDFDGARTTHIERELNELYEDISAKSIDGREDVKVDYTKGQVNYILRQIIGGKTYSETVDLLHTTAEKVDSDSFNREILFDKDRDELIKKMDEDLKAIEIEANIVEKERLVKAFNKRYVDTLKDNNELKIFVERHTQHSSIKRRLGTIESQINVGLIDYVAIENNRVIGKADELMKTGTVMDASKKATLDALRKRVTLETDRISITELENVIRAIIAGDIDEPRVASIDFGMYNDETALSDSAKEIRIVPRREEHVRSLDGRNVETNLYSYTDDSRFGEIARNWGDTMSGRASLQDLYSNLSEVERVEGQIAAIDEQILDLRGQIDKAPVRVITPGIPAVDVDALQKQVNELREDKGSLTTRLAELEKLRSSISTSAINKSKNASEIRGMLAREEVDFIQKLARNPGFQDYAVKIGVDPSKGSMESLWEGFIKYAQGNVIKTGATLDPEVVAKIGERKATPERRTRTREMTPEQERLRGDINDFIDDMRKLSILEGENNSFLTSLKRKVRTKVLDGSFTDFSDILKIEVSGKRIPLHLIIRDGRFDDLVGIESFRRNITETDIRIDADALRKIWKHIRIKI